MPVLNYAFTAILLALAAGARQDELVMTGSEGQEIGVRLVALDENGVHVRVDGRPEQFATSSVQELRRRGPEPAPSAPPISIGLLDGTLLGADQAEIRDGVLALERSASAPATIPQAEVAFARFAPFGPLDMDDEWTGIVAGQGYTGDLLVFRRDGHLDYLEGVAGDVTADSVQFKAGGRTNQAPRSRVEGLVFFHATGRTFGDPLATVTTLDGDSIPVRSARLDQGALLLSTVGQLELRIPLSRLHRIRLANNRVAYLGQLEPTTVEWQPLFAHAELVAYQRMLNRPRFGKSFAGTALRLRVPSESPDGMESRIVDYSHGIAVRGGTRLVFELAGEYQRLTGIAGFPPDAPAGGLVELVISADGRERLRTVLEQSSPPLPIDVDVAGTARLTIQVEYHDNRNIGDTLHLCDLKV